MNAHCAKFIDDQQLLHWQHYQRKRVKLLTDQVEKTQPPQAASGATSGVSAGSVAPAPPPPPPAGATPVPIAPIPKPN